MNIEQEYELVDLDGDVDVLRAHPQNPNQGDDVVVDESIEVNGWYGAIVAQKSTGYVLAGHTRFRVAKARKAKQVPVIWKDVDDETALRIMLVDNESARRATMDEDVVGQILDQLGDIRGTGVLQPGYGSDTDPDEVEAADEEQTGVDAALDAAEADEEAENGVPEAADVPDDVYAPQYGVMLVVESEGEQAALYTWINGKIDDGVLKVPGAEIPAKLRVVAV